MPEPRLSEENIVLNGVSYSAKDLSQLIAKVRDGSFSGELPKLRREVSEARKKYNEDSEMGKALTLLDGMLTLTLTAARTEPLSTRGNPFKPVQEPKSPERFEPQEFPGPEGFDFASQLGEAYFPKDKDGVPDSSAVDSMGSAFAGATTGAPVPNDDLKEAANSMLADGMALEQWKSAFIYAVGQDQAAQEKLWKGILADLNSGDPERIQKAFKTYYDNSNEQMKKQIFGSLEGTYLLSGKVLYVLGGGVYWKLTAKDNTDDTLYAYREATRLRNDIREKKRELESANEDLKKVLSVQITSIEERLNTLEQANLWRIYTILGVMYKSIGLETNKIESGGKLVAVDPTVAHEVSLLVGFNFEMYKPATGKRILSFDIAVEGGGIFFSPDRFDSQSLVKLKGDLSLWLTQRSAWYFDTGVNLFGLSQAGISYGTGFKISAEDASLKLGGGQFTPFEAASESTPYVTAAGSVSVKDVPLLGPIGRALGSENVQLYLMLNTYTTIPGRGDFSAGASGGFQVAFEISGVPLSVSAEGGAFWLENPAGGIQTVPQANLTLGVRQ